MRTATLTALVAVLGVFGLPRAGSTAVITQQSLLNGYVASAVASEQCGGKALTMLEESRLARVIMTESGESTSTMRVAESLSDDRKTTKVDCASSQVREQVRLFVDEVLPQLQSATPRKKTTAVE